MQALETVGQQRRGKQAELPHEVGKVAKLRNTFLLKTTCQKKACLTRKHILQTISDLYLFWKCCTEQHSLSGTWWRHVHLLYNLPYLWLKTHIQHPICLI